MSKTLQAVRGMNDILPDEAERWEDLEAALRDWLRGYGYRAIRTPLLEPTGLFQRAIGEATDIVEKEMYSFEDRLNGEQLTLRPRRCGLQSNTAWSTTARYGCITLARCIAMSGRKKVVTGSFTRSVPRPSVMPGRTSMPRCC